MATSTAGDAVVFAAGDAVEICCTTNASIGMCCFPAHIVSRHNRNQYIVAYDAVTDTSNPSLPNRGIFNVSDIRRRSVNPNPNIFPVGAEVEVKLTRKSPHECWYEARVESQTPDGGYVVVTKWKDLIETVWGEELRLRPPVVKSSGFEVEEAVEVCYEQGWWNGWVEEVVGEEYRVFVEEVERSVVCGEGMVRHQLSWVDGAWVSPRGKGKECAVGKRRKSQIPRKTAAVKRTVDVKTLAQVDSIGDDEHGTLVNKPSTENQSSLPSEPVSQGDTFSKGLNRHEVPTKMVDISCSNVLGTPKSQFQHNDAETEHAAVLPSPKNDTTCALPPLSKGQVTALPFVKQSSLWNYLDLNVMPKLKQHPHFRPLGQFPGVVREGMAVGLMVDYEYLMSGKRMLQLVSSCQEFDDCMKKITQLEENGFEVQRLRANAEEMQKVKSNHTQLLQKKSLTEGQTSEMKEKNNHLQAELEATDKAATAMEVVRAVFHGRRTSLSKQKEENDAIYEEALRQLSLVEENLLSAQRDMQDLLAAV